jgi:hypothetical protein
MNLERKITQWIVILYKTLKCLGKLLCTHSHITIHFNSEIIFLPLIEKSWCLFFFLSGDTSIFFNDPLVIKGLSRGIRVISTFIQ